MKKSIIAILMAVAILTSCDRAVHEEETVTNTVSASTAATTILMNGKFYTLNPKHPWAEAVAIKDSRILFVGSSADATAFHNDKIHIIDLENGFAMPSLIDGHVHPVLGGMEVATQCRFPPRSGPEDVATKINECIKDNPDSPWIAGGRWDSTFFEEHDINSPAVSRQSI